MTANDVFLKKLSLYSINGDKECWGTNINKFDWVPGVGLYGIFKAYEKTEDNELLNFLLLWTEQHLEMAYEKETVNSVCPMLTVAELYAITGNGKFLDVCRDVADFMIKKAPLTREGGLEHTVTEDAEFSEQMWADTLFMAVLFLAKMGKYEKKYLDFAINQLKIHLKYLCDDETGLFFHSWNCEKKNHMSAVKWGRANAWIIYSAAEILKTAGGFEERETVERYVKRHASSLAELQRKNGAFGTVLDDENSYCEASATAGIVAGIKEAVNLGIISEKYNKVYKKGIDYLKSVISEDGLLREVSYGTPVLKSAEDYKKVSIKPALYGQGLASVALALDE